MLSKLWLFLLLFRDYFERFFYPDRFYYLQDKIIMSFLIDRSGDFDRVTIKILCTQIPDRPPVLITYSVYGLIKEECGVMTYQECAELVDIDVQRTKRHNKAKDVLLSEFENTTNRLLRKDVQTLKIGKDYVQSPIEPEYFEEHIKLFWLQLVKDKIFIESNCSWLMKELPPIFSLYMPKVPEYALV